MTTRKLLIVGTAALLGLAVWRGHPLWAQHACEAEDGRWAAAQSTCIASDCLQTGTCGTWANPSARCAEVQLGDAPSEVFFQLGMPDRDDGQRFTWQAGKGSSEVIQARFEAGRLVEFSCPATTPDP